MVWLDLAEADGNGLYLEARGVEWRPQRGERSFAGTGMGGGGRFEGDVLLEVGREVIVTFADEWLAPERLRFFFARVERSSVEAALGEAARELAAALAASGRGRRDEAFTQLQQCPHPCPAQLELPLAQEKGRAAAGDVG